MLVYQLMCVMCVLFYQDFDVCLLREYVENKICLNTMYTTVIMRDYHNANMLTLPNCRA